MKRSDELVVISRRTFVALAGGGGLGLVVACNSSSSSDIDAAPMSADAPSGSGACSVSGVDVGAASTYTMGVPVLTKRLVVMQDANGFYAMSAACTHQGQLVCIGSTTSCISTGTDLYCTRHGAAFSFTGLVVRGPATSPLPHYAMCTLANGNLGVLTTMTVPASTRFQP